MKLINPATMKCDNLFDPTDFVNAPTNDPAKIGLAMETTTVLSLINLSETICHGDRVDPRVLHNRNHLNHFRRLTQKALSMLSLVVRKTTVCVYEPIFGSNIADVDAFFARICGSSRATAITLPNSRSSYHGWMNCMISVDL